MPTPGFTAWVFGQAGYYLPRSSNAQAGYATAPCGLQQRPLLTYSLLAHGRANYYLDTTNGVVRQVALHSGSPNIIPTGLFVTSVGVLAFCGLSNNCRQSLE